MTEFHSIFTACGNISQYVNPFSTTYITSPNYPNPYHHNANCTWTVTTNSSMRPAMNVFPRSEYSLYIVLRRYAIEHHRNCNFDSLQIDSNPKICGVSNSSQAYVVPNFMSVIKFLSDGSIHTDGFNLDIKSIRCKFFLFLWIEISRIKESTRSSLLAKVCGFSYFPRVILTISCVLTNEVSFRCC